VHVIKKQLANNSIFYESHLDSASLAEFEEDWRDDQSSGLKYVLCTDEEANEFLEPRICLLLWVKSETELRKVY